MANELDLLEKPEVEVEEEPTLRETLEEAFDEQEAAEAPEVEIKPPVVESAPTSAEPDKTPPPGPASEPTAPATPVTSTELKAPSQWKPAVREKWNMLPREVQEEVLRREGDSMRLIGSVGPKIRLADEVGQHIAPYLEKLSANGVSPSAFIGDLFTSVQHLSTGNAETKAAVVANIVQSYGVDVAALDRLLSQRLSVPPEIRQAQVTTSQAQGMIRHQQALIQQQSALEAEKSIAAFGADPKHEFLSDVRTLMADLIDSGQAKTLEDAYAAATWAHPDTRKILLQREAQTRATSKSGRAQAARRASSAIHGSPATLGVAATNSGAMSLRESIESAFDEHSSP